MIEQNWPHPGFVVHCDSCSNDEEIDTEDFNLLIARIKRKGWTIYRGETGRVWMHRCPACSQVVRG